MGDLSMTVIGGDWAPASYRSIFVHYLLTSNHIKLWRRGEDVKNWFNVFDYKEKVRIGDIVDFQLHGEQGQKSIGGAALGGAAGALIAGPVGLLAGLIAAGNKTEVFFSVTFRDGRSFTAKARAKLANEFLQVALANVANEEAAQRRAQRQTT